jgi:hypothetical protein
MENYFKYLKFEREDLLQHFDEKLQIKLYSFKTPINNDIYSYKLPDWLLKYVNNALYAIPDTALKTLEFLFEKAVEYDDVDVFKGYDTIVREELHDISYHFLIKAVYLLTDHYYNPDTEYYKYGLDSFIDRSSLKKMVIYQLLSGLIGRGMQKYYAFNYKFDTYYTGVTHYQNDYWLSKIIDNEEAIQEKYINKITQDLYHADENVEIVMPVEHEIDEPPLCRYNVTFMFYQRNEIKSENFVITSFEDNFTNDIEERKIWKYKVLNFNESSAIKLAFNTFVYDLFGDVNKYSIHNPITKLKYNIELIKEHIEGDMPEIELLKK